MTNVDDFALLLLGNLVLHYKEKHPGSEIPEALTKVVSDSDLQRAEAEGEVDALLSLPIEQRDISMHEDMEVWATFCLDIIGMFTQQI